MALISQNNNIPMDDINPMDYDALRAFSIDYIQKISGKLWTDFNIHDPGVSILEAVCFALSDLAYRTNFAIQDLLTPKNGINPSVEKPSFLAEEILPCNPTTLDEYRKLILEHIPGVRNVWVEKKSESDSYNGFYNVYVELEEEEYNHFFDKIHNAFDSDVHSIYKEYFDENYKKFFEDILRHSLEDNQDFEGELPKHYHRPSRTYKICYQNAIKKLLTRHRNLCEDFANIVILDTVYLGFKLGINIKDNADPNDIIDKLYTEIDKYVSPVLQYHTVHDFLDKGMAPEDIFKVYHQEDIPTYGLIDIQELRSMPKKFVIYYSDIYNIILSIDGVEEIKEFKFIPTEGIEFLKIKDKVYGVKLCDEKNCVLKLTPFQLSTKRERMKHWVHKSDVQSEITLYTNNLPISAVLIPTASKNTRRFLDEPLEYSLPKITSSYRNVEQFHPVQKLLPQAYAYIPDSTREHSVLDHAKKHQLKGYLDFFNQLLAEYISKLSSISSYFSIEKDTFPKPYYWDGEQEVSSVTTEYGNVENMEIISADEERSLNLQNKLLDHLMARFNDTFADYATLLYTSMDDKLLFFEKFYGVKNSIGKKKVMLGEYPSLSGLRSQGVCYNSGKFEISGVERRILARLGICHPNYRLSPKLIKKNRKTGKRTFQNNHSDDYERTFGIHILEHILFAPIRKDVDTKTTKGKKSDEDKFSFTVSVVIPGWLDVCLSENFRDYVENIILEEIPAHIKCNIYWVNPLVMWDVENAYVEFLNVMSKQTYPHNHSGWIEQHDQVVEKISNLLDKNLGDDNSNIKIPLPDDGSLSCDSWELVSDDNDDENFDRTDSLVL